ncbi:MAG: circadian clock KaiB family protein [Chitinophagaceae bacterium]
MTKIKKRKKIAGTVVMKGEATEFVFRLFITGALPNSARAVANSKTIFEKYLAGRYTLEVVDIYQQPDLAISEDIVAVPVLIKKLPLPEERLIGDLSDTVLVLKMLNLVE